MNDHDHRERTQKRYRQPESGTWPLYVLCCSALVVSGLVQLVLWKVPQSVTNQAPSWYDTWFIVLQPTGAAMVLAALYLVRPIVASLQMERVGCTICAVVGIIYTAAVSFNNQGPPSTMGSWMIVGFGLYCIYRVREIGRAFKGTTGTASGRVRK